MQVAMSHYIRSQLSILLINFFLYFTSYYAHICIKFLSSYSSTSLNHEKSPNSSIMLPHPQHVTRIMTKLSISYHFQNIYPVFIMFWSSWREIRASCSPFFRQTGRKFGFICHKKPREKLAESLYLE